MTRRLAHTVWRGGVAYRPGCAESDIPADLVGQIGAHAWAVDVDVDGAVAEPLPPAPAIEPVSVSEIPATGPGPEPEPTPVVESALEPEAGPEPEPEPAAEAEAEPEPEPEPEAAAEAEPAVEAPRILEPPAHSGPGSSLRAWAAYATTLGVDVPADASRGVIIAAIEAAGYPV